MREEKRRYLTDEEREEVRAYVENGHSAQEAADKFNMPVSSVYYTIRYSPRLDDTRKRLSRRRIDRAKKLAQLYQDGFSVEEIAETKGTSKQFISMEIRFYKDKIEPREKDGTLEDEYKIME